VVLGLRLVSRQLETYKIGDGDETSSAFPRSPPTLEQPSPYASFQAASDAFRRTHVSKVKAGPKVSAKQRKSIELGVEKEPPTSVTVWEPKSSMTKFKALVSLLSINTAPLSAVEQRS
jgi:hypothetical protein